MLGDLLLPKFFGCKIAINQIILSVLVSGSLSLVPDCRGLNFRKAGWNEPEARELQWRELIVATLNRASLFKANLNVADLNGAIWNSIICPDGTMNNCALS